MIKLTLAQRIFVYFTIVIFISLVSTAVITYYQSSKEFDHYMYDHMSQTINNAVHHTNVYLREYELILLSLLASDQVRKFAALPGDEYYDHVLYGSNIREHHFRHYIIQKPELASIYIISKNGQSIFMSGNRQGLDQYPEQFDADRIYHQLDKDTMRDQKFNVFDVSAVMPEESSLLTLIRRIPKLDNIYDYSGILAIEIHKSELELLWQGIELGDQGFFFVVDNQGKVIYHPDDKLIGQLIDEQLNSKLQTSAGEMLRYNIDGEDRVLFTRPSDYAEWNLVVSTPFEEMRKPINNIRSNTFMMSIVTLAIALLIAIRFGRMIMRPIRRLMEGMFQTEHGRWEHLPLTGRNDEMDDLTRRYNMMVTRLSELMEEVRQAEMKKRITLMERKQAELQALQLQVNPHFLYNTLETIACYAVIQDSKEITSMVKHLADMFRYAVKTDLEEVTIANELKHVLNYLEIMNHRIGWEFEIDVTIPPEYLLRNMVRLTLQPLVENAFQHAFPDGIEEHHQIVIDAYIQDQDFIVTVEDNGVGMSEEKLAELEEKLLRNRLSKVGPGGRGGIGVVNVHRRIQMVFGEEYGLSIQSKQGLGTKMLLRMPL